MSILSLFGLVSKREASMMAKEANIKGYEIGYSQGFEGGSGCKVGSEIVTFSKVCRKYNLRIVSSECYANDVKNNLFSFMQSYMNASYSDALDASKRVMENVAYSNVELEDLIHDGEFSHAKNGL